MTPTEKQLVTKKKPVSAENKTKKNDQQQNKQDTFEQTSPTELDSPALQEARWDIHYGYERPDEFLTSIVKFPHCGAIYKKHFEILYEFTMITEYSTYLEKLNP